MSSNNGDALPGFGPIPSNLIPARRSSLELEGPVESSPDLPSDELRLSLTEFLGFWRQGRLKVRNSTGIAVVNFNQLYEKGLRDLVGRLQHFKYQDNPDLQKAVSDFHRFESKLTLKDWKILLFCLKVEMMPDKTVDRDMVESAYSALGGVKDRLSDGLALPSG